MNHTNIDQLPLDRFPHAEYVRARDSIKPVLELSLLKEVVDAHRFHYGIVSNAEGISWDACFSLLLRDPDMRDALLKGWQRGIFDDLRGTGEYFDCNARRWFDPWSIPSEFPVFVEKKANRRKRYEAQQSYYNSPFNIQSI